MGLEEDERMRGLQNQIRKALQAYTDKRARQIGCFMNEIKDEEVPGYSEVIPV